MPVASCYSALTSAFSAEAELRCASQLEGASVRRRTDVDPLERSIIKKTHTDEDVFNKFIWLVSCGLPYRLHVFQRRFFDRILQVLAEYLLGDSWTEVAHYYRQKYGWKHMNRVAFAMAARRFGKTVVAGQAQAALALAKASRIVTLSTGKRASEGMRNSVLHCIRNSPFAHLIGRAQKAEEIHIYTIFDQREISSLRFLPASPPVRVVLSSCIVCSASVQTSGGGMDWPSEMLLGEPAFSSMLMANKNKTSITRLGK